ncbi:hypothetical protein DID75_01145 [Candidatus Marinamargulisbacteria bacterium SCGC AG-410-N11]|nr:hypothetical protein DID75_01145 [Candidatus Marinamargulisbacteria bacterium SCGC AG-410-N11]
MEPTEDQSNKDELEYNDGLGDLLREKERLEFSWKKTTIVVLSMLFIILVGVYTLLTIGKNSMTDTAPSVAKSTIQNQNNIDQIKKNNIDLIKTAAIEQTSKSTTTVKKSVRSKQNKTKRRIVTTQSKSSHFKVIVGSFSNRVNANALKTSLSNKGLKAFVNVVNKGNKTLYRVQSGAFKSKKSAVKHQKFLEKKGFHSYVLYQ